jgi:hypothetical protein
VFWLPSQVFAHHPAANPLIFEPLSPETCFLGVAGGHESDNFITMAVGHFLFTSGEGGTKPICRFRAAKQFSTLCMVAGSTGLTKCWSKPDS